MSIRHALAVPALLLAAAAFAGAGDDPTRTVVTTTGPFEEVRANLADAIVDEGLVESSVAHVGTMLARTADAVGDRAAVYGDAEVVEFCSAPLTHEMVAADPHALVHCPYRIAVYTFAADPDTVYLAYPRPTAAGDLPAYRGIEALLQRIVDAAL